MLQFRRTAGGHAIHIFVDPGSRARNATFALGFFVAASLAAIASTITADPDGDVAGITALVQLICTIGALVFVLMWVHRVNANAHTFVDWLSITPGWNVGWFFVPLANLWRPFEGIRESWQASENHEAGSVPPLLRAWWGCWLVGNLVGNASFQATRRASPDSSIGLWLDVTSSIALIAAAGLLIVIMHRLTVLQRHTHAARVFA